MEIIKKMTISRFYLHSENIRFGSAPRLPPTLLQRVRFATEDRPSMLSPGFVCVCIGVYVCVRGVCSWCVFVVGNGAMET